MHAINRRALVLWALCATLLCFGSSFAQERAKTLQTEAERQFQDLHERMQNLEAVLARTEPEEGSRLEAGNRFVQERALRSGMADVKKLIESGQYDEALGKIDDLQTDLQSLLDLLLDRDTALRDKLEEMKRLENYKKRVDELLDQQTSERDASARSAALERHLQELDAAKAEAKAVLKQQQDLHAEANQAGLSAEASKAKAMAATESKLQQRTDDLTAKLRKIEKDGEKLGTGGKQGSKAAGASAKAGENASGAMGKAGDKLGQNKPERSLEDMDRAEQELQAAIDRLEDMSEEARRKLLQLPFDQQVRAQERTRVQTDRLAEDMEKDDRGQNGDGGGKQTPGKKNIQQAVPKQKAAAGQLKDIKPGDAKDQQDEAVQDLKDAQKQLEDALAQLRQELQDQVLRALEERFAAMLTKQRELSARTKAADQVRAEALAANDGPPAQVVQRASQVAVGEHELSGEASDAIKLLEEDGTSAAYPMLVGMLRDDLDSVAARLEKTETGKRTQLAQAEIEQTLADLIEGLRRQIEQNQGGGACNCNGQPVLVPTSAELKLVMIKQKRVNRRTKEFDSSVPDQLRVTDEAKAESRDMARQQGIVEELLRKMADKMSKEGEDGF